MPQFVRRLAAIGRLGNATVGHDTVVEHRFRPERFVCALHHSAWEGDGLITEKIQSLLRYFGVLRHLRRGSLVSDEQLCEEGLKYTLELPSVVGPDDDDR